MRTYHLSSFDCIHEYQESIVSAKRNYHHSNNRLQKECGYINKYILIDVNDRIFRHLVRGLLCQKLLVIKLLLI